MDNEDLNQPELLPDPLEGQSVSLPTPAPVAAPVVSAVKSPMRNKYLRAGLAAAAFVAVMLLVFFGQRIGELFHLFGTKAGQSVILDSDHFMDMGWHSDPSNDCFTVTGGKLMLSNPGDGSCSP